MAKEFLGIQFIKSYDELCEDRKEKNKKAPHDPVDNQMMECESCCRMGLTDERGLCKVCYEEGY